MSKCNITKKGLYIILFVVYLIFYYYVINRFFHDFKIINTRNHYYFILIAICLLPIGLLLKRYIKLITAIFIVFLIAAMATYQYVYDFMGVHIHVIFSEVVALLGDTNLLEIKSAIQNMSNSFLIYLLLIFYTFICLALPIRTLLSNKIYLNWSLSFFLFILMGFIIFNKDFIFYLNYQNYQKNIKLIEESYKAQTDKQKFKWGVLSQSHKLSPAEKDVVVIILGETTRGDRFEINGYHRNTNPLLKTKNIISFNNAISNAAYTLTSTPYILTRKPVGDPSLVWNETSLISAYKEAGYTTYYISYLTQAHVGDNSINQIVAEADYYIKRPWDGYDGAGLPIIKNILEEPIQKQLIIYKLIGSHFNYQDRYPNEFDKFQPSYKTEPYKSPTIEDKEILDNTYDNSILYTDYVVGNIIDDLEKINGYAMLAFISDHGSAIFEDGKSIYGGNTPFNFDIAYFFWFNKTYQHTEADKINLLNLHVNQPVDSTSFIDTMLDLTGISTQERKGYSLVVDNLPKKQRKVYNVGKVFDYDEFFFKEGSL